MHLQFTCHKATVVRKHLINNIEHFQEVAYKPKQNHLDKNREITSAL